MKFVDDLKVPDQPYPELREVLQQFVDGAAAVLGDTLIGVYLVGSIASGDFDEDSDVDFLVVTKTELSEVDMKPLQDVQARIQQIDCYPAKHLECSYISVDDLNNWSIVGEKNLYYFDNGSTTYELSTHDNQWHVRWILRERGITLIGPSPKTILREIPADALKNEITALMLLIVRSFEDEIEGPINFWNSRFGQTFSVLTYCRMLHTLHTGTVQSKKAGAVWAKEFVDPQWIALIDRAWADREGVRFGVKRRQLAEPALLRETLNFMKYAVTLIEHVGSETQG